MGLNGASNGIVQLRAPQQRQIIKERLPNQRVRKSVRTDRIRHRRDEACSERFPETLDDAPTPTRIAPATSPAPGTGSLQGTSEHIHSELAADDCGCGEYRVAGGGQAVKAPPNDLAHYGAELRSAAGIVTFRCRVLPLLVAAIEAALKSTR